MNSILSTLQSHPAEHWRSKIRRGLTEDTTSLAKPLGPKYLSWCSSRSRTIYREGQSKKTTKSTIPAASGSLLHWLHWSSHTCEHVSDHSQGHQRHSFRRLGVGDQPLGAQLTWASLVAADTLCYSDPLYIQCSLVARTVPNWMVRCLKIDLASSNLTPWTAIELVRFRL